MFNKNIKIMKMCWQIYEKTENYEIRTDKFMKKQKKNEIHANNSPKN